MPSQRNRKNFVNNNKLWIKMAAWTHTKRLLSATVQIVDTAKPVTISIVYI